MNSGSCDSCTVAGYTDNVFAGLGNHMETVYKVALVGVLLVVLFTLGQALFFMMTDRASSKRSVGALTRRISFSLLLFAMIALGIWMGWLHPHGINPRV